MGAEIFDVEVNLDGVIILYATKISSKKNKDNSTTLTFNGDINTSAKNTGGTISIEGLYFPTELDEVIALENKLNAVDEDGNPSPIKVVTCSGTSYTAGGDPYRKTVIGSGVTVTNDEDEWSPSDGISQKIELSVDNLTRSVEKL